MRLLQRYIFFEVLRVFLFLVTVLTVLLVCLGLFREASERGLGASQIFQILPYIAPSILPFTIPATLLLAVCVVYGRVAGDQEVIAVKAAGVSVMSLLTPAFTLAAILTVVSFSLTNHVIPWAMDNIERVVANAVEDIFLDVLGSQHQINNPEKGYSITVAKVDGKRLVKPVFKYAINKREQATVVAGEATIDFDLEKKEVVVHVKDAMMMLPGQDGWYEEQDIRLQMPSQITKMKPRNLSIDSIREEIATLQAERDVAREKFEMEVITAFTLGDFRRVEHASIQAASLQQRTRLKMERKLDTEIHSRFAMAGSCFLFVFLGAPFSILQARRQFLTSFIMCFIPILLVYYPIVFLMMNLAKSGSVEPWWGMWVANIVIGIGAAVYLRRVIQH